MKTEKYNLDIYHTGELKNKPKFACERDPTSGILKIEHCQFAKNSKIKHFFGARSILIQLIGQCFISEFLTWLYFI